MADMTGQAEIRGLDIDKTAKGFADEAVIMKKYCQVSKTKHMEIRWYSKTAGFLDSTDTDGMTSSRIANAAKGAVPEVIGQSWTRTTSYVRKYFVESETMAEEEIKSCDLDIIATTVRDLVRGVGRQIDLRIYNVLTESDTPSNIQTVAITHEWDDADNAVPISDMLTAKEYLKNYNYDPEGAVLMVRPDVERFLMNHLISVKGSSIPQYASAQVEKGVVMRILGFKLVTSTVVTADKGVIFVPKRAITWKQFMPITSVVIKDPGIGRKIRVWEEGEALLTDPKAVVFFSNIGPT